MPSVKPRSLLLIPFLLLATAPRAEEVITVPAKIQASIIAKVLGYDRNLAKRSGEAVVIGVVTDARSADKRGELWDAFSQLSKSQIGKLPVSVISIHAIQAERVAPESEAAGVNAIYESQRAGEETIKAVLAWAQKKKAPAFCDSERLVERGFVFGIGVENEKPRMIINFAQAKIQGLDLPSTVLQLSKIIR
jgi:hypothetical protein